MTLAEWDLPNIRTFGSINEDLSFVNEERLR
jgi:hypothetical protein